MSSLQMPPVIELKNIQKVYPLGETSVIALQNLNLSIHKKEFIAIWGPSGSGKTTLCNLISLTDTPTSGSLMFNGTAVSGLSDNQKSDIRNKYIGFVFQNFNLIPVLSALDNVMLPLQIQGTAGKAGRQKARNLLETLGLEDHITHRPGKLSGGQQQRVAIARALITDPLVIVADEPTANLDSENAMKIIELMKHINDENQTTFIFSTHDQRLLSSVNRRIHLMDGQITTDVSRKETKSTRLGQDFQGETNGI
jgi:putative ABC transport system ATP-binding protein